MTEFRGDNKSFAADVTYKRYEMTSDNKLINSYSTAEDKTVDISKIKIVSTNQAPVRFKFNASFVSQKYYRYNVEKKTWQELTSDKIIYTDPGIYLLNTNIILTVINIFLAEISFKIHSHQQECCSLNNFCSRSRQQLQLYR